MREVGYFRELPHGDSTGPALREARGALPDHLVLPVVAYLRSGSPVVAAAGYACDELDEQRPEVVPLAILTDGSWTWPSDLAFYVEKYRVGLPEEFLTHAENLGWRAPQLTPQEIEEIAEVM